MSLETDYNDRIEKYNKMIDNETNEKQKETYIKEKNDFIIKNFELINDYYKNSGNKGTLYKKYLELVPSGHLDAMVTKNGFVDHQSKIVDEFEEETGISKKHITNKKLQKRKIAVD